MRGFQLWINLPAREKMKPAAYRDIPAREIPTVALAGGGEVRVIAGEFEQDGTKTAGPIGAQHRAAVLRRAPAARAWRSRCPTPARHNTFLYVYEGDAVVGDDSPRVRCRYRAAGLLTPGDIRARSVRASRACGCCCSPASRSASRSCSTDRS